MDRSHRLNSIFLFLPYIVIWIVVVARAPHQRHSSFRAHIKAFRWHLGRYGCGNNALMGACCMCILCLCEWFIAIFIHERWAMTDTNYDWLVVVTMRCAHHTIRASGWNVKKWENAADVGLEVLWLRIIRGLTSKAKQQQQNTKKKTNNLYEHRNWSEIELPAQIRIPRESI